MRIPAKGGLHLNHDHDTGEFRGWACWHRNAGIGKLGDTPEATFECAIALGVAPTNSLVRMRPEEAAETVAYRFDSVTRSAEEQ
jgi:hypothetical protein